MTMRLGDVVPDFTCRASKETFTSLYQYMNDHPGHWLLFFSHPADFTPVCTTELGALAVDHAFWQQQKCLLLGLSIDDVASHLRWEKDILAFHGLNMSTLPYPIVADVDGAISTLYDMLDSPLHDATNMKTPSLPMTVRACLLIDAAKRVRCIWTYPASTGRNFMEIKRVLTALRLSDAHAIATPANWRLPDSETRCLVRADVSDVEAAARFADLTSTTLPYVRYTSLPSATDLL